VTWFDLPGHPAAATVPLLVVAALVAGWVDAVVGGGGLIQLPALLIGLPAAGPAQVLATNKLSGIAGTATAALTYARRIRPDVRTAAPMALTALAGAAAGAACATLLPQRVFRPLVLVLIIGVGAYTLRRPDLGRVHDPHPDQRRHRTVALVAGAGIGFYDGIFGPGTGSFLVFVLVGVLGYGFLEASALARITNFATNLGALLVFVPHGAPLWHLGLVMATANVAGGYLGARTAAARGSGFVRTVFLVVVAVLIVRLGWDVAHGR
jgi:uncharacterized membrane protein YfcA